MKSLKEYINNINESKLDAENPLSKAKVGDKFFITLLKYEDKYAEIKIADIKKKDENNFKYWGFRLEDNSLDIEWLVIGNEFYGKYEMDGNFCRAIFKNNTGPACALIGKTKEELQNEIDGQYGDTLKTLAKEIEEKQKELNDLNDKLVKLTSKIKLK